MKTITEYVKGLSNEEIEKMIINEIKSKVIENVFKPLSYLNYVSHINLNNKDLNVMQNAYKDYYNSKKEELKKLDLWNPEYDSFYEEALNGILDEYKLKELIESGI